MIYLFLKFGEYFSFRVMNVHAKFQHRDVFWKGCTKIVLFWGPMHSPIDPHWFSCNLTQKKINPLKNTKVSVKKKQKSFILACQALKYEMHKNL